jgi:hypothetical protein
MGQVIGGRRLVNYLEGHVVARAEEATRRLAVASR